VQPCKTGGTGSNDDDKRINAGNKKPGPKGRREKEDRI
jgi:hypothetical protein